jgi:hypothetical protein
MNGLEFASCTTAGGFDRILVHAAPHQAQFEVRQADDTLIASDQLDRDGSSSPMTVVTVQRGRLCSERDLAQPRALRHPGAALRRGGRQAASLGAG